MNRRKVLTVLGIFAGILFVTVGVFAANNWFPQSDPVSGKRYGWFGKPLAKNASSSWNPIAAVLPSPTPTPPQLAKEYIYAGSRLLAVEDANATAAPPADIAVWTPSNGVWAVKGQAGSTATTLQFGMSGDVPIIGDYDGDGKTDFTVWRPASSALFYVWPSNGSGYWGYYWGTTGDKPSGGDFDGDGITDYVIARPNPGTTNLEWWVLKSSDSNYISGEWGNYQDTPAVADYDGDGRADFAVYRSGDQTFYVIRSSDSSAMIVDIGQTVTCAQARLCIVSSDYDGDGKADPAVYVDSTATWYIHQSTTNTTVSTVWGNNGASGCTGSCTALVPVHNDYDLDGKTDLAVWDNATNAVWTIKRSSNGTTRTETFGTTNDIPVPAFYRR